MSENFEMFAIGQGLARDDHLAGVLVQSVLKEGRELFKQNITDLNFSGLFVPLLKLLGCFIDCFSLRCQWFLRQLLVQLNKSVMSVS